MEYPSEFQDLLRRDYGSESYIGQGNPASKILIIGKECAAPKIRKDGKECIVLSPEFIQNAHTWKTKSPESIENWVNLPYYMPEKYHPRRPYLGQLLLENKKIIRAHLSLGKHINNLLTCYYLMTCKFNQGNNSIFMSIVF